MCCRLDYDTAQPVMEVANARDGGGGGSVPPFPDKYAPSGGVTQRQVEEDVAQLHRFVVKIA